MFKIQSKGVPLKLNSITGVSLKCYACLSTDREMYILNDTATVNTVCPELVYKKGLKSNPAIVCFECCAMIKKIFRFRKQVIYAQDNAHFTKQNASLSRLSVTSTECMSIPSTMTEATDMVTMATPNTSVDETIPLITVFKQEMDTDEYDSGPLNNTEKVPIEFEIAPFNIKEEPNHTQIPFEPNTSTSLTNNKNNFKKPITSKKTYPVNHQNEKFIVYGSHKVFTNNFVKIKPKTTKIKSTVNLEPNIISNSHPYVVITVPKVKKVDPKLISKPNQIIKSPKIVPNTIVGSSMLKIQPLLSEFEENLKDVKMVNLNEAEMVDFRNEKRSKCHFKSAKFKCDQCIEMFNAEKTINAHKVLHSEKAGPFECKICTLRFSDEEAMNTHYNGHYCIYECLKCSMRFATEKAITIHVKKRHAVGLFECKICNEEFKTFRELKTHKYLSHTIKETCPQCNKVLSNKAKLRAHMLTHSLEHEECPICNKVCKSSRIKIHLATHKKDLDTRHCAECDITFQSELSYKAHMKKNLKHNTIESFGIKCEPCNKYFAAKHSLVYHNEVVHNLPKNNFTCNVCKKDYVSKRNLRSHFRHMHIPSELRFVCEICDKSYRNKKSLKSHIDTHFGRRPYKCQDCGDTFTHSAARYLHRRLVHKVKKKSEILEKEMKMQMTS